MVKQSILASLTISGALLLGSCTLDDTYRPAPGGNTGLTLNEKVVLGLKTALAVGIDSSSTAAHKVNGYLTHKVIKILLPEEASQALQAAQDLAVQVEPFSKQLDFMQTTVAFTPGLNSGAKTSFTSNLASSSSILTEIKGLTTLSDSLIFYMNRAAEYAAPRSAPIFKQSITGMSITDGLTLLNSPDSTAATVYLTGKTFDPLVTAYTPIVDSTLRLVPLTQYWSTFRENYNDVLTKYNGLLAFQQSWNANAVVAALPGLQVNKLKPMTYKPIVTESLGAWTTTKALGGLFYLVGEEEKGIRRDPVGYIRYLASDIYDVLKEVFGEIMKMEAK